MKHFKLILLLSALTFSSLLRAQYELRNFGEDQGLVDYPSTNFYQMSDGYVWYLSSKGLCRFDGFEVERFEDPNNPDIFMGWDPGEMYEKEGGVVFEQVGVFYLFKSGTFYQINSEKYEELIGARIDDISKNYELLHRGCIYQFKDGNIVKDSLPDHLRDVFFALDNSGMYRSNLKNKIYTINHGSVDSIEIIIESPDQRPDAAYFGVTSYQCFSINDQTLLLYSAFSSYAYIIENGEVADKITIPDHLRLHWPDDESILIHLWYRQAIKTSIFWTDGENYSLFAYGLLIKNGEPFEFDEFKEYHLKFMVNQNQALCLLDEQLYLLDFERKKPKQIHGINGLSTVQYPLGNSFSNGKYWISSNGITLLTPSRIEYYDLRELTYEDGHTTLEGLSGKLDKNGNWSGTCTKFEYISRSVLNPEDVFDLNISSNAPTTYKIIPKPRTLGRTFNDGKVKVYYTLTENGLTYPDKNFIVTKGKEIQSNCDYFSFADDTLFGFNSKLQKWFTADFESEKMVACDYDVPFEYGFQSMDKYRVSFNSWRIPNQMSIYWNTDLNRGSIDSLSFQASEKGYEKYYLGEGFLALIEHDQSDSLLIVDLKGFAFEEFKVENQLFEKGKYYTHPSLSDSDEKGRMWIPSENGITEIDCREGCSIKYYRAEFLGAETKNIKVVHDTILMILTNDALYAQKILPTGEFEIENAKKIFQFENGSYDLIMEMENGSVSLGNYNWSYYITLPSDFYTKPLYDKPIVQLKSLLAGNNYVFGQFPEMAIFDHKKISTFDSEENDLYFKFTALDFRNLDYLSFRYKLDGWEDHWVYTDIPEAKFNNLAEGDYTLTFQSKYMDRFSEPFVYTFTIKPPWYKSSWAYTFYIIGLIFLFWVFLKLRTRQLLKKQEVLEGKIEEATLEIREQKEMVEERNQEIMDSITYAKRLQNAILPPPRLVKEWLNDSFIFYKPKDIVAGDFYWMETTKRNGRNVIFYAAADCTGHGVPGAMVSVVCSNALNRAIKEFGIADPGELLDKVAEIVQESFSKSEDTVKDGMDIAVCAVDLIDRKLWFAGAHNALYRITNEDTKVPENVKVLESGSRKLVEYRADKQPVGAFEHMEPFTTVEIQLEPGDCIYLFSDGFADQFGGEKGKKFKYKPFKELLLDIEAKEMDSQKDILDVEFERWRGNLEQVDDVCIIGLRVNGHMRKLFSNRELEVIKKIKEGLRSKEIADKLNIAKSTVDSHRKRILAKTNLNSVVELIKFCDDHEVL